MTTKCPLCGGVEEATRVTFTATLDGNLLFGPDRPRHAAAVACLLLCYPPAHSPFHGLTELGPALPGPRCAPTREIDKKA